MTDELFFTLDDVRAIRKVSVNINDFDVYAQEVQINYIEKILGPDLYTALLADLVSGVPQTQKYIDLVDGKTYTKDGKKVTFRGLKKYCSYLWIYVYLLDGSLQITPIGAKIFKDEEADHAEGNQANRQLRDHSIRMADSMEEGIIDFLENDNATYPEFSLSDKEEPASEDNFTFNVIGNSYFPPKNKFDR